jgi:hypothetical protein
MSPKVSISNFGGNTRYTARISCDFPRSFQSSPVPSSSPLPLLSHTFQLNMHISTHHLTNSTPSNINYFCFLLVAVFLDLKNHPPVAGGGEMKVNLKGSRLLRGMMVTLAAEWNVQTFTDSMAANFLAFVGHSQHDSANMLTTKTVSRNSVSA